MNKRWKSKRKGKWKTRLCVSFLYVEHLSTTCTVYAAFLHLVSCAPLLHSFTLPCSNVIILSSPAPVLVREAIHPHVLVWGHCRHPTKILRVWQPGRITSWSVSKMTHQHNVLLLKSIQVIHLPVSELVHGHRHVCGKLFVAGICVVIVLRQQVDVVKENTAPVFISERLPYPNIQQLGTVKSTVPPLKSEMWAD